MQWTSEKCLSEERISNPRTSLWQAKLFRYQVHEWTKTLRKFSKIRLWIDMCPRGDLQRHKYNNLDRVKCPNICIQFLQTLWKNRFSPTTMIFITSLHRLLEHWKVWRRKVKHKCNFCSSISRQQLRLSRAVPWRNLPNVIIDESTRGLTWVKMIVIKKFVPQLNFHKSKKNQLFDLQESLQLYCNVLPLFCFNMAKYYQNLMKSYLLPIFVKERDIKPFVIKKANQFIPFKFGEIQLLDIMYFLGEVTSLDSFLKAFKTSKTKRFFPTNRLITLTKCRTQNFRHMTPFTVNFVAVTLLKLKDGLC